MSDNEAIKDADAMIQLAAMSGAVGQILIEKGICTAEELDARVERIRAAIIGKLDPNAAELLKRAEV